MSKAQYDLIWKAKELLEETRMYDLHGMMHSDVGSTKAEFLIRVYTILQMIGVEKNDLFRGPDLYERHLQVKNSIYLDMQDYATSKWVDNLVDDAIKMIDDKYRGRYFGEDKK